MSQRETILAAIATTLAGQASGRVYRSRQEQLPALPAVVIEPISETAEEAVLGVTDRRLVVGINVYSDGLIPDSAADSTLAGCWAALYTSQNLGIGQDIQLRPEHDVEWDAEDYSKGHATLRITIHYRTANGAM